jgi:hypothetical protein
MQAGVWDKMMRGLSTRNYGAVVKDFHNAYGIEKSTVAHPGGPGLRRHRSQVTIGEPPLPHGNSVSFSLKIL